jgi:tyrosine-protein phosphatase SIW14
VQFAFHLPAGEEGLFQRSFQADAMPERTLTSRLSDFVTCCPFSPRPAASKSRSSASHKQNEMTRLIGAALLVVPVRLAAAPPPGIEKFEQINEHLYRGGQPSEAGFQALAKMGIRTILDLRDKAEQSRLEKNMVEALGMRFIAVPMSMHAPTDQQIDRALDLLNASEGWPVFVHCQGGRDRTSTVIACYRISHDGWDNQKAYNDARQHGISVFDIGLRHYILRYEHPSRSISVH